MPLSKRSTRVFHRITFAGQLETITMLKHGDNQRQGTVTSIVLYQCRWGLHTKTGNTVDGDMNVYHARTLHIPRIELDRVGVAYINPPDEFVDAQGRRWINESDNSIAVKLFENHVDVDCKRRFNLNGP